MSHFFDLNTRRFTHREYWWGNRSPMVIIAWIIKWLRIPIPGSADDANVDSTLPFRVESSPPEITAAFEPLALELQALGFHSPIYHVIRDYGTQTAFYWATWLHASGLHFARIHHRTWDRVKNRNRGLFPMFFTEFNDGTFLVSSAGKPDMEAPDSVRMNRMRGAATLKLWSEHQRLAEELSRQSAMRRTVTADELAAAVERHHILLRDFHLARGVFHERTTAEQDRIDAYTARVETGRTSGVAHPEILAELDQLQEQKKPAWSSTIWILVLSGVAFFAAGAAQWDWKFTLILIPVLLFHESGHWIAMRLCRYRNLRMFFIPFFGAAVTGRNWNVPGWKKALVSLAGPVPGIVVGMVLGTIGMVLRKEWLNDAATVLLLINGFNLLPVLPLDGGHVVHATLFCRNRWLDLVFRIAAIAGMFLLGSLGGIRMFVYLIIPLVMGLPVAFKLAQTVDHFRRHPLPPPLPGEDWIPPATAEAIVSAVKAAVPKNMTNKMVAMHSLSVYETLNARPPGVLATIGLLTLHGGAAVMALLFGVLLTVNKHAGLGDFVKAAARQPRHAISCADISSFGGGAATNASVRDNILVTFHGPAAAADAFSRLQGGIPAAARLVRFGDTVVLSIPNGDAAREQWFDKLQGYSTNLFVAASNAPVTVAFTFLAPTIEVASNLQEQISGYFEAGGLHLVPPWSPDAKAPGMQAKFRARQQWRRIGSETSIVWSDPSLRAYNAKMRDAFRRGAQAEMKRLSDEHEKAGLRLQDDVLKRLRAPGSGVDPELVDLHAELFRRTLTNRVERLAIQRRVAARLGEEAYTDGHPDRVADAYSAGGGCTQHGLLLELRWGQFQDPIAGPPAFVRWLCESNCRTIKYDFFGVGEVDDGDDEGGF
jgi:Zn-dependent protease